MNSNFVIRMSSQHLDEVQKLADELGYPDSSMGLRERFSSIVNLSHHALFIYYNDKVLGWIHLEKVQDLIEETKLEVKALVVKENHQGQGIGATLIEQSKNWARDCGLSKIYLSCNIARQQAHGFYEHEGFKKVKTSHFFELEV